MCGIAGRAGCGGSAENQQRTLDAMQSRGPDNCGEWSSAAGEVWLGHRRLSIVDLSANGNQPMHNETRRVWLVCNGEVYNYPDLRKRLEGLGHHFYSNSDSEAILHAWEQWGTRAAERLDGMFAFILWDMDRQTLYAARDHVGIKPLVYTLDGGGIRLASDGHALKRLVGRQPELQPLALAYVMTLGYVPAPHHIWRNFHKLEPGHWLTWSAERGLTIQKYWEPPRELHPDPAEHAKQWPEIFEQTLAAHLLADVPVSLFLSAGLDSSALAVGLKLLRRRVDALTVSFTGNAADEAPLAAQLARAIDFPHQSLPLSVESVDELIVRTLAVYDEPQSYSALLTMFLLCRGAARKFKVALAGDGGDEIFGGYTWYDQPPLTLRIKHAVKELVVAAFAREGKNVWQKAISRYMSRSCLHTHAWRLHPRFLPEEAAELLAPTGLRFSEEEQLEPLRRHFVAQLPLKRALQRVDLMNFCTDSILAKVDRASMAHSLEVRVPYLSRALVEWGLTSPELRTEREQSKPYLRNYLRPHCPPAVLSQPKQGFSLKSLEHYDFDGAARALQHGTLAARGLLIPGWRAVVDNEHPQRNGRIWNLYLLDRWLALQTN